VATKIERKVEQVRTVPSTEELLRALARASERVLSHPMERPSIALLVAQIWLETGRLKSCFNFNLGNVRDLPGDGFDYVLLWTWEILNGQRWEGYGAFRAHESLEEGACEHLKFLTDFVRRPKYKRVWDTVMAGDASQYAHVLKAAGYYTAPEEDYARGIRSLSAEFLASVAGVEPPSAPRTELFSRHALDVELPDWQPATSIEAAFPAGLFGEVDDVDRLRRTLVRGFHRVALDAHPHLAETTWQAEALRNA
jgi:hypothetical protein